MRRVPDRGTARIRPRTEIETDDRQMGCHAFERDARRSTTLQPADGGSRYRRSGADRILAETSPQARTPGLPTDVDEKLAGAPPAPLRWTFSGCHLLIMALDSYQPIHVRVRAVRHAAMLRGLLRFSDAGAAACPAPRHANPMACTG